MGRTPNSYSQRSTAPGLQKVWQSMRILRTRFDSAALQTTAEAGKTQVEKYLSALHAAGYLRLVVPRVNGRPGSRNVYALVRDSGPTAPICRKHAVQAGAARGRPVYDPNTHITWGPDGQRISQEGGAA